MRARLAFLLCALVLSATVGGCSGSQPQCSPCPPGTRASNPAVACSACVAIDGGADASDGG